MIKRLKPYGLQHALPVFILSWLACIIDPMLGMAVAIYGAGRYEGREQTQSEYRGMNPLKPKTWKFDKVEWVDFLPVYVVSGFNVWMMLGML